MFGREKTRVVEEPCLGVLWILVDVKKGRPCTLFDNETVLGVTEPRSAYVKAQEIRENSKYTLDI